jgi:neutral amino acid transport system permease protein
MDILGILIDALRSAIGVNGAVFALAAVGLNVHFGYTGLLNFGHVAFLLVGGYGAAIVVDAGGHLLLGVFAGMVAAAILALLLGIPTLRLRTDYLAIVTIAMGEILRLVVRSTAAQPLTKGVFGIQGFAGGFYETNPFDSGIDLFGRSLFTANATWVILITWTLVIVTTLLVWALMRSPWGRTIKSIREDEDAARSLGKNVFSFKMQALVLGGVIGSLAGVMRALDQQSVNPDSFVPLTTFFFYALLILGGAGTTLGPIIGSMIFWFLLAGSESFLLGAVKANWISESLLSSQDISAVRFILVGLTLVLLMTFRPQGIFGSREEMLLDAR